MAKRQQVTKLLAVMAMTSSPALAGPEHDHSKPAAAPTAPAAPAAPAPAAPRATNGQDRTQPAPARPAQAAAQPAQPVVQLVVQPSPGMLEAILALFGLARPRELPNGRPAPGNVQSRAVSPERRR